MSDLPISLAEYYRAAAAVSVANTLADLGLHAFWGHGVCSEHGPMTALVLTDGTEPAPGYIVCSHVGFKRRVPVRRVTRSSAIPFAHEEGRTT